MIYRLALRNFKGWRELELDMAPITLLFGTNSSGKTAVLQALLLLKQTVNSRDPNQHLNFGGGKRDYVGFGSYQDLAYGHDMNAKVGIGLKWTPRMESQISLRNFLGDHGAIETLGHNVSWRYDDDIVIEELGLSVTTDQLDRIDNQYIRFCRREQDKYKIEVSQSFAELIENGGSLALEESSDGTKTVPSPESCYRLPYILYLRSTYMRGGYPPHLFGLEMERLVDLCRYLGPLRVKPERLYIWTGDDKSQLTNLDGSDAIAELISSLKADGSLHNQVSEGLGKLGLLDSFTMRPVDEKHRIYEPIVKHFGQESSLTDVGFGVSQVLPVLTLLFSAPVGSIILLEQPELHLHPSAQAGLADLMLLAAEERQLQLIVETHSEHLLRRFQRRIAEVEMDFAKHENIKAYFCNPTADGLVAEEVIVDRFGQIDNWPEHFFGDIGGDLHNMAKAAITRRRGELQLA